MKEDYWDVSDGQVIEKTGKPNGIKYWMLLRLPVKKSNDVVAHLQQACEIPGYWARTLSTLYLKQKTS